MIQKRKLKKLFISFIMAAAVFTGLLAIERALLKKQPRKQAVKVIKEIEAGFIFTPENLDQYVTLDQIEESRLPEEIYSDVNDLMGLITTRTIYKYEIIMKQSVKEATEYTDEIPNPVEISIKVNDISQVVGGVLREGDLVDISVINSSTNESNELLKRAFVTKAIHADGSLITREDTVKSAIVINLLVDKNEEIKLNNHLNLGMIRFSKVLNR